MKPIANGSNSMETEKEIRLQLYLARGGAGSRRACERFILRGLVAVDGITVTALGTKVTGDERITLRGKPVIPERKLRHIALYKPAGYVCTESDPEGRPIASSLIRHAYPERLYHVGRLDLESEGLIFFTNDGAFARTVMHPSSVIEKEYLVETGARIGAAACEQMVAGITIEGVTYRIDGFTIIGDRRVMIRLHEGKNRELRELFRHFEYRVKRLERTRIGIVTVDSLPRTGFRPLSATEINWFMQRGSHS
jgi:23S rRNA pseudouridine2605 synthase